MSRPGDNADHQSPLRRRAVAVTGVLCLLLGFVGAPGAPASAAPSPSALAAAAPAISLAAPRSVPVKGRYVVSGSVAGAGSVVVERRAGRRWVEAGRARVSGGKFRARLQAPPRATRLTLRARLGKQASAARTVAVLSRTRITLSVPRTATAGSKVVLSGVTKGAASRTPVRVEQRSGGVWRRVSSTGTNRAGRYRAAFRPASGTLELRARLARKGLRGASTSPVRRLQVSGPASLTIQVVGVPEGRTGRIHVTDPAGVERVITRTTTISPARAGVWTAVGESIDEGAAGLRWPGRPSQSVTVAANGSSALAFTYDALVPTTTKVADPGDVTGVMTGTGGLVEVRTNTTAPTGGDVPGVPSPTPTPFEPGDVFVAGPSPALPRGLLGRIVSVTPSGAGRVLVVDPSAASLLDAASSGSFDAQRALTPEQLVPSSPQARETRRRSLPRARGGTDSGGLLTSFEDVKENIACESEAELVLEGEFNVGLEVGFDAGWGASWSDGVFLDHAKAYAEATQDAHVTVTATGAASCVLEETPILAEPYEFRTFTVMVGVVPVVLTPEVQFYADGLIEAEASAEFGYTEDFAAYAEVDYDHDRADDVADRFGGDFEIVGPNVQRIGPNFDGSAAAELALTVEATMVAYKLTGPSIKVRGALMGSAELAASAEEGPEAEGSWSLDLGLGVTGSIEVDALDLSSGDLDIWDNYEDPWNIASGEWVYGDGDESGSFSNLTADVDAAPYAQVGTDPQLSANGRVAAWWSDPDGTLHGGDNGLVDASVTVRELASGETTVLSPPSVGGAVGSVAPALSADGRWVAFLHGWAGGWRQLWLHDRSTGTYERVDAGESGATLRAPDVAADGSVAYVRVRDDTGRAVLWNRGTGLRVVIPSITQAAWDVDVSDDATKVLVTGRVSDDWGSGASLHDLSTGGTVTISRDNSGSRVGAADTALSGDGSSVTFTTTKALLGENNGPIYRLYRWRDGQLRLLGDAATLPLVGRTPNVATMSSDGRFVAYAAYGEGFGGDSTWQVVRHDVATGARVVLSRAFGMGGVQDGSLGDLSSSLAVLSGNGRAAVFSTGAGNLVDGDHNQAYDVYLWRGGPEVG